MKLQLQMSEVTMQMTKLPMPLLISALDMTAMFPLE